MLTSVYLFYQCTKLHTHDRIFNLNHKVHWFSVNLSQLQCHIGLFLRLIFQDFDTILHIKEIAWYNTVHKLDNTVACLRSSCLNGLTNNGPLYMQLTQSKLYKKWTMTVQPTHLMYVLFECGTRYFRMCVLLKSSLTPATLCSLCYEAYFFFIWKVDF